MQPCSFSSDTAVVYRNENHIGEALKTLLPKYKLNREDIFITSKLSKEPFFRCILQCLTCLSVCAFTSVPWNNVLECDIKFITVFKIDLVSINTQRSATPH